MEQILFAISALVVINWLFKMTGHLFGNSLSVPAPIFHLIDWGFTNTYISSPAIAYQAWFWANFAGVFAQ